jgi:hypothetical protein
VEDASFENLMKRWFPLTYALNSLNRSLGMPDGYPFTLASPVVDKLRFVHRLIAAVGDKTQPREVATRAGDAVAAQAPLQTAQAGALQAVAAQPGEQPAPLSAPQPVAQAVMSPEPAPAPVMSLAPAPQPVMSPEPPPAPVMETAAPAAPPLQAGPAAAQTAPAKRAARRR